MANSRYIPNQKHITIHKEKVTKEKKYICTDLNALTLAATKLKAGAFKLWIYLSKNQDLYNFGLSPQDTAANFGIKADQYDTAVKSLIALGYLVQKEDSDYYDFYEIPQKKKEENVGGKTTNEIVSGKNTDVSNVQGKTTYVVVGKNSNDVGVKTTYSQGENPPRNNTDNTFNNTIDNTNNYPVISKMDLDRVQGYYKDLGNGIIEVPSGKRFKLPE